MIKDYFWKLFESSGDINAYLAYRDSMSYSSHLFDTGYENGYEKPEGLQGGVMMSSTDNEFM